MDFGGSSHLDTLSLLEKRLFDSRESLRRRLQNLSNNIESSIEKIEDLDHIVKYCEVTLTAFIGERRKVPQKHAGISLFFEENVNSPEFNHIEMQLLIGMSDPLRQELLLHSYAVASCAEVLFQSAGGDSALRLPFVFGALLHDVGVLMGTNIEKFDLATIEKQQEHTKDGERLLRSGVSRSHHMGAEIARSHHERWNGGGHPDGLSTEAIPFSARVVSICDMFDTLMIRIQNNPGMSPQKVNEALLKGRGVYFDPALTDLFCERFDSFLEIRSRGRNYAQERVRNIEIGRG